MIKAHGEYVVLKDANVEKKKNGLILPKTSSDYDVAIVVNMKRIVTGKH